MNIFVEIIFIKAVIIAIFGTVEKYAVIIVGDPW